MKTVSKTRFKKQNLPLLFMLAIPCFFVVVYRYIPILGNIIAFQNYLPAKGFLASKWVGVENFRVLFNMPGFFKALRNTVIIALWKIALGVLVPVTFTLMLNEMKNEGVKKGVQTLIYMPHFVSWVLLAGIFSKLLSSTGVVNQIITALGGEKIIFLGDNHWFRFTLILTNVWKEFGFGTIVYLAAVAGVDVNLYEAAEIDGAGHWQQVLHITLPSIVPIVILMTCLSLGNILNAGFDQVFNMYSPIVYETGDILDTLIYRMGLGTGKFSLSTAANIFKSAVSFVFIVASYRIAYKCSGYKVF